MHAMIPHPGDQTRRRTAEGVGVRGILTRGAAAATLTALALAAASTVAPTTPTSAAPSLTYWYGTVTKVVDGDTVFVDIEGDGTSASYEVRNAGIQATELANKVLGIPKDECHSREAKERMRELVFGANRHVRLSAYHASSRSLGRLLRYIDVDVNPDPKVDEWVDIQRVLLEEAYVWWKPEEVESANNGAYNVYAQRGMQTSNVLYDQNYLRGACEKGPRQGTPITTTVQYNGFHPRKGTIVNREWVKFRNGGTKALPLKNWTVRTASHNKYFHFPSWASIPAGGSVLLRSGQGTAKGRTFYWGSRTNMLPNPVHGRNFPGKGIYLVDPDGDVRATMIYPCLVNCSDPLEGKVEISNVVADSPGQDASNVNGEYVEIRSTGGRVNLSGYVIERQAYNKMLPGGTVLEPGDRLRLHMGRGHSDLKGPALNLYMGANHPILGNSGGSVVIRTDRGVWIDCSAWGNGSC